jgi:hypothetical protein
MKKLIVSILIAALLCLNISAGAQEIVVVGHSGRAALSIGRLLYGIERGFYCDEGWVKLETKNLKLAT